MLPTANDKRRMYPPARAAGPTCLLSPLPGYSNMKLGLGGVNFPASIAYPPQSIDGGRESGGRRTLDKVVNSLDYEMLLLMLLLTLSCAALASLAGGVGLEREWRWS